MEDLTKLKPSALIRYALNDLEKVEKDDRYRVDMNAYHEPQEHGPCYVCLVGSIAAKTLLVPPSERFYVDLLRDQDKLHNTLEAVDVFSTGKVGLALGYLDIPCPEEVEPEMDISSYYPDPDLFKRDMRAMATLLEGSGL